MKPLFSYTGHRDLLSDFYEAKKKHGSYSYRLFSEKAGIRSPNFLKLVIDGKKSLTVENIHRFAKAMELRPLETEYFEALVLLSQASSDFEKSYYRQRILKLKAHAVESSRPRNLEALMSDWYFPAVLTALDQVDEKSDLAEVARKCGIPQDLLYRVIEILSRSGALEIKNNRYRILDQHINLEDRKATSRAHREFIRRQLEISKRALDQSYGKNAKFACQTFTFSKKNLHLYNDQIHSMMDVIYKISDNDERDAIAQLNVQFFPLDEL